MHHLIALAEKLCLPQRTIPKFGPGDTVVVTTKIKEGEKEITQNFEGVVIQRRGNGLSSQTFTVRKVGQGSVGVERVFSVYGPTVVSIQVRSFGRVRRAKLFYLRDKKGKAFRVLKKEK